MVILVRNTDIILSVSVNVLCTDMLRHILIQSDRFNSFSPGDKT